MSDFIKAETVVSTALGLLERALVIPRLVWRDAGGSFKGAKNDTITIRVPAYVEAGTRAMRSGAARTRKSLVERAVAVTLDTNINLDVALLDEELTLDIENFGTQVLNPVLSGVARAIENEMATAIQGATYVNTLDFIAGTDDPYADLAVPAREALNKANVPFDDRFLLVGAEIEAAFLNSDKFSDASKSGSTGTLRDATIGRVVGFDIVTSNAIDPSEAFAFHRTAFVLSSQAPIVPDGAPWGAVQAWNGYAIRLVQILDPDEIQNVLASDVFVGANVVTDHGEFDAVTGVFTPYEDPDESGNDPAVLARAVGINVAS